MDMLWYGLKVAVVGMLVVFVGLVILIGCIKALKLIGGKDAPQAAGNTTPAPQAPAVPAPPRTYVPGPALSQKDDAFYAVLTAAIAATLESEGVNPEGGFAIRAVKPVSGQN